MAIGPVDATRGCALDRESYLKLLVRLYGKPYSSNDWTEEEREWNRERSRQFGFDPASHPSKSEVNEAFESYVRRELLDPLLEVMPPEQRRMVEDVPIGLVNMRTLNAQALRAPDGKPVIVLNQGILSLVSYWWELKASMASVLRSRGSLSSQQYLLNGYCFVLLFFRDNGQESYPWTFEPLSDAEGAGIVLRSVQTELFILAHEVSHIILGHPLSSPAVGDDKRDPDEVTKQSELSRQQEHEADLNGYNMYLAAWLKHKWSSKNISIGDLLAPVEYFSLRALVEQNPEIVPQYGQVATHPSALDRAKLVLLRLLQIEFDEPLRSEVRTAAEEHWRVLESTPNVLQHFAELGQWVQRELNSTSREVD